VAAQKDALTTVVQEVHGIYLPSELADLIVYLASVPTELQWDPRKSKHATVQAFDPRCVTMASAQDLHHTPLSVTLLTFVAGYKTTVTLTCENKTYSPIRFWIGVKGTNAQKPDPTFCGGMMELTARPRPNDVDTLTVTVNLSSRRLALMRGLGQLVYRTPNGKSFGAKPFPAQDLMNLFVRVRQYDYHRIRVTLTHVSVVPC